MDFQPTSEQQLIRQTMREFAETEVKPIAAKMDPADGWPEPLSPPTAERRLRGHPLLPGPAPTAGKSGTHPALQSAVMPLVWA